MECKTVTTFLVIATLMCLVQAQDSPFRFPESFPSKSGDPLIILGQPAQPGEIPYQAYLYSTLWYDLFVVLGSACGGSLIRSTWALTAAHCIANTDHTEVRLGGININNMTYRARADFRMKHEQFNSRTLENDVALLRLPWPAYGRHICSIALAPMDVGSLVGDTVIASGFGRTENKGAASPNLMRVDLQVISNEECRKSYGQEIVESTLCASWNRETGEKGQSTCSGDSGGPLARNDTGTPLLVGVISFVHRDGCDSGTPSGYARVSSFLNWINTTIANNST